MIDGDQKVMNQTPNPKTSIKKRTNLRKSYPLGFWDRIVASGKSRYSNLSALLSVIVSFLLVFVSFLIFCAICVQAGIYFFQLKQMKKSTGAAIKAANAAEASVKQAKAAARHDQRAWVAVIDTMGIPEVGKIFTVNLTALNSGKTFAKNLSMRAVVELITEEGKEPDFSLEDSAPARKDSSVSLLPPNTEYVTNVELRKQTPPHEITESDFDRIRSGNLRIVVHGKITYDDMFGCSHWTSFCTRLKSDLKYASYGNHNDADQNRCP
jgi:hypothetical protein